MDENQYDSSSFAESLSQSGSTIPPTIADLKRTISIDKRTLATIFSRRDCLYCRKDPLATPLLEKKYNMTEPSYNKSLINEIIFNENTHIVAVFKDYLIFDDTNEFLRRYYRMTEAFRKIKEYANKISKCRNSMLPNLCILNEASYIQRNIKLKKRAIDEIKKWKKIAHKHKPSQRIFDTKFINELKKCKSQQDLCIDISSATFPSSPAHIGTPVQSIMLPCNLNLRKQLKCKRISINSKHITKILPELISCRCAKKIKEFCSRDAQYSKKKETPKKIPSPFNYSKKSTECSTKQSIISIKATGHKSPPLLFLDSAKYVKRPIKFKK